MSIIDLITVVLCLGFFGIFGGLAFLAYASKQSRDNPLRMMMGAVASRVIVTVGVGILDIPMTAIEPIGGVIDLASVGLLAWYWISGIRQMMGAFDLPSAPPEAAKSLSVRSYAARDQPGD